MCYFVLDTLDYAVTRHDYSDSEESAKKKPDIYFKLGSLPISADYRPFHRSFLRCWKPFISPRSRRGLDELSVTV